MLLVPVTGTPGVPATPDGELVLTPGEGVAELPGRSPLPPPEPMAAEVLTLVETAVPAPPAEVAAGGE